LDVWVIESGDYEQRSVNGVADSVESAVAYVRTTYAPPYIVAWEAVVIQDDESAYRKGKFARVLNYSIECEAIYTFSRYDLQKSKQE
jgi:hypothetical protein